MMHNTRYGGIRAMYAASVLWIALGVSSPIYAAYHALVVGIDQYLPGYASNFTYPFCKNDANGFRSHLLQDGGRWSSSRIRVLTDSAATKSAIRTHIQGRARVLRSGDVFVYFQSSHGGNDPSRPRDAFLSTHNADYTDRELASDLARFNRGVSIIVIIDACNSGGMFKGSGGEWNFAANVMEAYHQEVVKENRGLQKESFAKTTSNIAFMTASDFNQLSIGGRPNSVYTKYILQAMRSRSADNAPRNGSLSFWEAQSWAKPRASSENSGQTAQHRNESLLRQTVLRQAALPVPSRIGPSGTAPARPTFRWRAVSGAQRYELQVFNSSGRLIINRTGLSGTSWTTSANLPNGNYRWRVRGVRSQTFSSWSQSMNFRVGSPSPFVRRITLTWGATPRDLDAHLQTPTGIRINHSRRGSSSAPSYARLHADRRSGFGPEVISVHRLLASGERRYSYYVYNFSNERRLAGSGARVRVEGRNGVIRTFVAPTSGTGRYWHVFDMTSNGSVIGVNRIRSTSP
jgi:hypothetical protein